MKKLGFGLMRLPNRNGVIDMEELKKMVDHFIDHGFTYFDTSYVYHGGKSETAIREALVERHDRSEYTLTDKLPIWMVNSKQDVERLCKEQLRKTGVEYFDYYLMHAMNYNHYLTMEKIGAFEKMVELRDRGLIRHVCMSFHDTADVLDTILTRHQEIEYVQVILNYLDMENEGIDIKECYETIVRHGRKVIVMEPVKGGVLASLDRKYEDRLKDLDPEMSDASWAIRYAASQEGVFVVLSGMSNMQQMTDNTSYMEDFEPLNNREATVIKNIAEDWYGKRPITTAFENKAVCHYVGLYNNRVGLNVRDGWQDIIYGSLCARYGKPQQLISKVGTEEKKALMKVMEVY